MKEKLKCDECEVKKAQTEMQFVYVLNVTTIWKINQSNCQEVRFSVRVSHSKNDRAIQLALKMHSSDYSPFGCAHILGLA